MSVYVINNIKIRFETSFYFHFNWYADFDDVMNLFDFVAPVWFGSILGASF